ncbi:DUF167 domain-containing protein [Patescibacteria group bacterium]|nr:MAG: DUF167 domain-containing protein [Patescibacteria group bacterium]
MYIKVRVMAGAKKETFKQKSADHFEVAVKEPAEQNRANRRVISIFEAHFHVSGIRLVSGHHSPSKILSIPEKEGV